MTEDPFESEEYQKFVEEQAQFCSCEPLDLRPCEGVLSGGPCDRVNQEKEDDVDWEDCDNPDLKY